MNHKESNINKTFDPKAVETKWYKLWEEEGYFKPRKGKSGTYCIIMPPPNVTGRLHAGHALDLTTQDALIRFKRMKGFETLFLPGMDHAGIATQNVVEKMLQEKEGKDRNDFSREDFIKRVWQWKEEYGGVIAKQQRAMGASPDWDYSMFTMDPDASAAVKKVFVDLYNEGLIYQADYIVNWDPDLESAISDAEIEHKEVNGSFYHIIYRIKDSKETIEIATTRPETLLGDTGVSVHPEDPRFKHLIGKTAIVPICNREVPIIADDYVDMEKGTGCLKVTPGHDFNDFEIGRRHNLPIINILNKDGTLNNQAGDFADMKVKAARKAVLTKLEELEILKDIKNHTHNVGHGDRSGAVIEPMVSKQWFLNVQKMAADAVAKVKDGSTTFFPKGWENTYFAWLKEPKDWCISRQLWWGHQIPIFYCKKCENQWADEKDVSECTKCNSKGEQDPDVLDTWFSSALWPFSTLGWPDKKRMKEKKFSSFFPGTCLITGHDIIFFWVARMMMMSLKFLEKIPFKEVYIHAIVRDAKGRKMSKSLGNGIDPLEMVEKYGADSFRFTLAAASGYNRGINLDPARTEGYRNFVNKVWNAFRFIEPHLSEAKCKINFKKLSHHEKWILSELNETAKIMNQKLEEYRYDDACAAIYSFVYDKLCSWFIELSKNILLQEGDERDQRILVLRHAFNQVVALLHPVTPFISEEIWSHLKNKEDDLLIISPYPEYQKNLSFKQDSEYMNKFIEVTTNIRGLRAEANINPKKEISVQIFAEDNKLIKYFLENEDNFFKLAKAKVEIKSIKEIKPNKSLFAATTFAEIFVTLTDKLDIEEQVKRLTKGLQKTQKELSKYQNKLSNPKFMANADPQVIEEVKREAEELAHKISSIETNLKSFS